jgi:hypothetical protein
VNDTFRRHRKRPDPGAGRYDYGRFPTPIAGTEQNAIGGGTFDPESGLLYLTIQRADRLQGTYANPPLVIVHRYGRE